MVCTAELFRFVPYNSQERQNINNKKGALAIALSSVVARAMEEEAVAVEDPRQYGSYTATLD